MKKICWLIALALALLLALPAMGEETVVRPSVPAIGEVIHGFTVAEHYEMESMDATCVLLRHEKSGAQLIYVATNDTNRFFTITFRTPADDDKGIPHVFEHATLSGSEKYPDPSLFSSMISQTYNTMLNAETFVDCTSYPSGSLSEDQLYAFADYLLAGVSHPLIMTDERSMLREAYRYELPDRASDITLTGTVYSEMMGGMTMMIRHKFNVAKTISPGSRMANISGGDPAVIPTLTHQDLKAFHDQYYHPSNALMVLYGSLQYDRFLALIDEEYLSEYEARTIEITDDGYQPLTGYQEAVFTYPVAKDQTATPCLTYAYNMSGMTDEEFWIFSHFTNALCNEGSPLKRLADERLPGRGIAALISRDNSAEPVLQFSLLNAQDGDQAMLKSVVEDAIAQLLDKGVDPAILAPFCAHEQLTSLTMASANRGYVVSREINNGWGRTGDVNQYQINDHIKSHLMDYTDGVALNAILRKYLTQPAGRAMISTLPKPGGLEEQAEALRQSLAEKKAAMSDAEINALVDSTAAFARWTQENAENSLIDKVKVVDAANLPVELVTYTANSKEADGVRYVTSKVDSGNLLSISLRFDASAVPAELLNAYGLRAMLSGSMATKSRPREQLVSMTNELVSQLSFTADALSFADGSFRPTLDVRWYCLDSNVEESFDLVEDILFRTDYSDHEQLRSTVSQSIMMSRILGQGMPHALIGRIANIMTREDSLYTYLVKDEIEYSFLTSIAKMSDDELTKLGEDMDKAWACATGKNGLIVTAVGSQTGIDAAQRRAGTFAEQLDAAPREPVDYTPCYPSMKSPLAIVFPGTMQYNSQLLSLKDTGFVKSGKTNVMQNLVGDKVLTNTLRFKNSAYGAACIISEDYVLVSSLRDPGFATTYEVYKELGSMIRELELSQEDLEGYITSAFSTLAMPMLPINGGIQAVEDAIIGEDSFGTTRRYMEELKQFTLADVDAYAALFDQLAQNGSIFTMASAQTVNDNMDLFETILDFTGSAGGN